MEPGVDALVGRERELAEASAWLDRALRGGGVLLLSGEAGIGKTRLARELGARAEAAGAPIHWTTCWEDPSPALWPWHRPIRAAEEALGETLDPAARAVIEPGAAADRLAVFEGVTSLLARAARARPMLVVIDDAHLADTASIALLRFLAGSEPDAPIAVVATHRSGPSGPEAAFVAPATELARAGARAIELTGLDEAAVAALMREAAGDDVASDVATRIFDRTRGNPLFVTEIARMMRARGTGPDDDLPLPASVRVVISQRLGTVSGSCLDVLATASVIGWEFDTDALARVGGDDPAGLARALDEADAAGLIAAAGSMRWTFTHPLVREALYAGLPGSERRRAHLTFARVLESRDPDEHAAAIAHHSAAALPDGDPAAAREHARRAGERALAVAAWEDVRADVRAALGDALARAGDVERATAVWDQAIEAARRRGNPVELARAALGRSGGNGFEVRLFDHATLATLTESLDALGDEHPALRAWLLARLSVAGSFVDDQAVREARSREAIELARILGDPRALVYALSSLCDAIAGPAHTEERIALADEMVGLAVTADDAEAELLGRRFAVVAAMESGDMASFDAHTDAFARSASRVRMPWYEWYVPLWRGARALMDGRVDECEALNDEVRALGARAGSRNATILADAQRLVLLMETERHEEALTLLRRFVEDPEGGPHTQAWYAGLLARAGRTEEAAAVLGRLRAGGFALARDGSWLAAVCVAADAASLVGDVEAAHALTDLLAPYAGRVVVDGIAAACMGSVEAYLGSLTSVAGDAPEAQGRFDAAIDRCRAMGATMLAHTVERRRAAAEPGRRANADRGPLAPEDATFARSDDLWEVTFAGATARVLDLKGLGVIARLLAEPGREFHVLDLTTPDAASAVALARDEGDDVLDPAARAAIKRRLDELAQEADEAEATDDGARSARARAERDAIASQLAAAFGIGGRARRTPGAAERARQAVTKRIKAALERLEQVHAPLARHLRNSIRTGRYCSYVPERPIVWHTDAHEVVSG